MRDSTASVETLAHCKAVLYVFHCPLERMYSHLRYRVKVNIDDFVQISDNHFGDALQFVKVIGFVWFHIHIQSYGS